MVPIKVYIFLFFVSIGACVDVFSGMDYKLSFLFPLSPLYEEQDPEREGCCVGKGSLASWGVSDSLPRRVGPGRLTAQTVSGPDAPGGAFHPFRNHLVLDPEACPVGTARRTDNQFSLGTQSEGRWRVGQASVPAPCLGMGSVSKY